VTTLNTGRCLLRRVSIRRSRQPRHSLPNLAQLIRRSYWRRWCADQPVRSGAQGCATSAKPWASWLGVWCRSASPAVPRAHSRDQARNGHIASGDIRERRPWRVEPCLTPPGAPTGRGRRALALAPPPPGSSAADYLRIVEQYCGNPPCGLVQSSVCWNWSAWPKSFEVPG
jgi:hypothetical protein